MTNPKDTRRWDNYVSPSRLSTFGLTPDDPDGCPRKWWYQYVLWIPRPGNAHSEDGNRAHEQIEVAVLDGTEPTREDSRAALTWLRERIAPMDVGDVAVELATQPIRGLTVGGLPVESYIDAAWTDPDGIPVALDWKFFKSPPAVPKPGVTADDPRWIRFYRPTAAQTVIYAAALALLTGTRAARVVYAYMKRGHAKPPRIAQNEVPDAVAGLDALAPVVDRMAAAADPDRPPERNMRACWKYGRCAYMSQCYRTPSAAPPPEPGELFFGGFDPDAVD